jgi:hypothetical protein
VLKRLFLAVLALTFMVSPVAAQQSIRDLQIGTNEVPPALPFEFGIEDWTPYTVDAPSLLEATSQRTDMEMITAGDNVGAFRFICMPGQVRAEDPLVAPGKRGGSHPHQFYGNTAADRNSTVASLGSSGDSTCQNILNRSAYWQITVQNPAGKVVRFDYVSIYYKRPPASRPECTPGNIKYMGRCVGTPNNIRYIFGYDMITNTTPSGGKSWQCVRNNNGAGPFTNIVDAAAACPGLPGNPATDITHLGVSITAPFCWNGIALDSANHRSHVSDALVDADTGRAACPKTHPYVIPTFTATAFFRVDATLNTSGVWDPATSCSVHWHLSSDCMPGMPVYKPGTTAHMDYWERWHLATKKKWTDNCINRGLSCTAGDLGNGERMKQVWPLTYDANNPGSRIVNRPKMAKESSRFIIRATQ